MKLRCGRSYAKLATVRLEQIDPGAAVWRIDHQVHGAIRREHFAHRAQARIRVRQMVKNTGANDVLEAAAQFACAFHRKLPNLEIVEAVFGLERFGIFDARRTYVDPNHLRTRPVQRVPGCLGGAAASDQHAAVFAVRLVRPEEVRFGAPSLSVFPALAVTVQVLDGARIRMLFVKRSHSLGDLSDVRTSVACSGLM